MHMHTIKPLPLRIEPQPWEELSSFLARTARHMQYARSSWLLQPELLPFRMTSRNLSLLTAQDDYTFLSALLALSEEQIYHMTLHPPRRSLSPLALLSSFSARSAKTISSNHTQWHSHQSSHALKAGLPIFLSHIWDHANLYSLSPRSSPL